MDFSSGQWWDCQHMHLNYRSPVQPICLRHPPPGNTDAAFINIISRARAKASEMTDSGKWMTTSRRDPIRITLKKKIFAGEKLFCEGISSISLVYQPFWLVLRHLLGLSSALLMTKAYKLNVPKIHQRQQIQNKLLKRVYLYHAGLKQMHLLHYMTLPSISWCVL